MENGLWTMEDVSEMIMIINNTSILLLFNIEY